MNSDNSSFVRGPQGEMVSLSQLMGQEIFVPFSFWSLMSCQNNAHNAEDIHKIGSIYNQEQEGSTSAKVANHAHFSCFNSVIFF